MGGATAAVEATVQGGQVTVVTEDQGAAPGTVSYTHLTLPTNREV